MIKVEHLFFEYTDFRGRKKALLDDISFEIVPNERVVLLGVNGSGKSTLLKILDVLIFAQKGTYTFAGEAIDKKDFKKRAKLFRKDVAFLMQDPNTLLFNATVQEEIEFGLREFGFDHIEDRAVEIAKRFNLEKYLDTPPYYLSGGEKQRVALAAILSIEPKVLLMDEPSSNLDPATTGWLIDLLNDMEVTTITSTHNLSLAHEFGNRALVLSDKHQLIFDGPLDTFYSDKELLMQANLLHKHKHRHNGEVHSHFHLHDW